MRLRTFGFKQSLILLLAVALWFFGPPMLRFGTGMATGNFYGIREICDSSEGCVTIVDESKLSLNSYINKYFFIGSWFKLPSLNNSYVMFEDGGEFCFVGSGGGRYKIYANMEPAVNNLRAYVEIHPLDEAANYCRSY